MSRATTSLSEREAAKIGRRGGTSGRHFLFAAAYIRNEGNGLKAAREAGYHGTDASLRVTASRLLKRAEVRAILAARMADVEAKIGGGMVDEEIVARLTAQARADITPFIQFITPELVQSMTTRMNIAPVVLPLYRRSKEDPEKVTEGTALDSSHRQGKRVSKRQRQLKS